MKHEVLSFTADPLRNASRTLPGRAAAGPLVKLKSKQVKQVEIS